MKKKTTIQIILFVFFLSLSSYLLALSSPRVAAQTASEIQAKIDKRNADIDKLEKEIKEYQKQIESLGTQALSLSQTIKSLELTRKSLEANIALTEDKIAAKNYEIYQLSSQISFKENNIGDNRRIIARTFASMSEAPDQSLPELVLGQRSISDALDAVTSLGDLQASLYSRIKNLSTDKANLETNKAATEKAKNELSNLKNDLDDQKAVNLSTAAQQSALLKETNQSEAQFKKVIAAKKAQETAFQKEINDFESQLNLLVNPALIPSTGTGVLTWPLDTVRITQYFGNTSFSTANPQIYNGKGHTGVDFGVPIGTPVKAALSGTVIGIGNTDLYPRCYSYGQWIMLKHADGLSTLYAHLSLQKVKIGQEVGTGEVIAYSGNTGYSTGPHLHFGVYATQGVQIKKFDTSANCKGATIPIADFKAYLNPLSYL